MGTGVAFTAADCLPVSSAAARGRTEATLGTAAAGLFFLVAYFLDVGYYFKV